MISSNSTEIEQDDTEYAVILSHQGFPNDIISIDGDEVHGSKEIYESVVAFQQFEDSQYKDMQALDEACKKGCYNALYARCNLNCNIMMDDNVKNEIKVSTTDKLLRDIDHLASLYWSVGCLDAAQLLLGVGDHFAKKRDDYVAEYKLLYGSNTLPEQNEYAGFVIIYYELAARYYLRAKFLLIYDLSQDLIKILYKGRGLEAGSGFASITDADATFFSPFRDDNAKILLLQVEEKKSVDEMTAKNPRIT